MSNTVNKCFGKHQKSDCKAETKVEWINYVANFISENEGTPAEMYWRWYELVSRNKTGQLGKTTKSTPQNTPPTQEGQPELTTKSQDPQAKEMIKENENETHSQNTDCPPTEEDFDIPMNEVQYKSMVAKFATIGLKRPDVDKV